MQPLKVEAKNKSSNAFILPVMDDVDYQENIRNDSQNN